MKRYLLIILLLGLAGLVFSSLLLVEQLNDPAMVSQEVCGDGWQSSCLQVTASPFSKIVGVPLAALGAVFYLWIMVLTLVAMVSSRDWCSRSVRIMCAVIFLALLADLFLAGVMYRIGSICQLCVYTYAVNLLLFIIILFWLSKESIRPLAIPVLLWHDCRDIFTIRELRFPGIMLALFSVTFILLGSTTGLLVVQKYGNDVPPASVIESFMKQYTQTEREKLNLPESSMVIGNEDADVEIVVFTDFLCSACYQLFRVERYLLSLFGDHVVFRYYHYPLDAECNSDVKVTMYRGSCRASRTLYAADRIGRFRDVLLAHYKNHDTIEELYAADAGYMDIYGSMGIDIDNSKRLQKLALSDQALKAVHRDVREAVTLSIDSTPTLFINGSRMVGVPPKEFLKAVVEYELTR